MLELPVDLLEFRRTNVEVQAVIKKKVFGVWVSNASQPLKFKALAKMSTAIDLGSEWNFQYSCRWDGLQWEQEPIFNVLGFKLDLSEFVEKQLTSNKAQLEDMLCDLLTQKIDTKPPEQQVQTPQRTILMSPPKNRKMLINQ